MKITLTKKQWDGIGKTAGRTKWPINPNAVDERAVDITKLLDYYKKEESEFVPPCDTCQHKHKKLQKIGCPCLGCTHYYEGNSELLKS